MQVHHDFKTNQGICAEWFHPLEEAVNMLPFLLGPFLLKLHLFTFCM